VPSHRFFKLDVFTSTPLQGNALAVFPDGTGLSGATMQALAREMNLSETTFGLPSTQAVKRVRIFTPQSELPLAGHPVIGTWWLLAEQKLVPLPADGPTVVMQETGAGILPVSIDLKDGRPTRVVMTQKLPEFGETEIDRAKLGKALGGDGRTVKKSPGPQIVDIAFPQLMVPVRSLEVLRGLPSGGTGMGLGALLKKYGTDCAMCYTMETESKDADVHCRMFAPGIGVPEDPATGSAAGALGAYLVWHNVIRPQGGVARFVIEQGIEIGRASRIEVEITVGNGGEITAVRVGGTAVTVMEGEVRL